MITNTVSFLQFQNQNPVITYVLEEQPSGTFVAKLEGCDADVKPNNKLYYYIICKYTLIHSLSNHTSNSTTFGDKADILKIL